MIQYRTITEAAEYIINVLKEFIPVNTLFIATNDGTSNIILKSFNRQKQLVKEGDTLPLMKTYCSLVFKGASSVVIIPDTSTDPIASQMEMTRSLGPCSFVGVPISTRNNETYGTICAMDQTNMEFSDKEITLLKAMAELISYVVELEQASMSDSLTGIYNRKYLEKFKLHERSDQATHPLSLIFIDIDDFKKINDTYGHDVGDKVLLQVVERLKNQLRKIDTIVRMGGDEFMVIIECTHSEDELRNIAQKVLSSMKEPMNIHGHTILLSISIGISKGEIESLSLNELIRKADQAMYDVKHHGKANFKISS